MPYIIVGLGNPGAEYDHTRHNAGRMVLEQAAKVWDADEWRADKKLGAFKSEVKVGKEKATLLLPELYMNNSGKSVKPLVSSVKKAHQLVVAHDDIDLPFGSIKLSFNRGSGGHRGIESIIRQIKTKEFIRLRIGVAPTTPSGKLRKPAGEDQVIKFILGKFKPEELVLFKKVIKRSVLALESIVTEGKERAMNLYNQ